MADYINIGVMLTTICLIAAWMFVTSRQHYTIKMVAAVIAVVLAIGIWSKSTALIGYPVNDFPPDGSVVLALETDNSEIAFWIEGKPPRSYAIPYDPDLARAMQKAQDEARNINGRMIFHRNMKSGGKRKGGDGQAGGGQAAGDGTRFQDNSQPVYIDVVPAMPDKG